MSEQVVPEFEDESHPMGPSKSRDEATGNDEQGKEPGSHVTGFSRFTDEKTGKEFHNTWDVKDKGDELQASVGGIDHDLAKFDIVSTDPEVIKYYREVRRQAARADYFYRRVIEAKPIPKKQPHKAKPRPPKRHGCIECDGHGFVWVGDVKETCDRCDGTGFRM